MKAALTVQKTEPSHSAECSVKRRWLKIGHTSKIPHTYTHFTGNWGFKNYSMNCYKLLKFKPYKDNGIHMLHITLTHYTGMIIKKSSEP
jgi:hypothetical protein